MNADMYRRPKCVLCQNARNVGVGPIFRVRHRSPHLGVARHDGVVAVVIQRGRGSVQRAGSVGVAADPVVFAPLGDLLAIFKPVDLRHKTRRLNYVMLLVCSYLIKVMI